MWLPNLEFDDYVITDDTLSSFLSYRDFIDKKLPLHRSPVIESLLLRFRQSILPQPEKFKQWVEIAVSRSLRELSVVYYWFIAKPFDALSFPSSLYTCSSLTTLKLQGGNVLVDVPPTVCLPSLKTLQLRFVDEDSLRLILSSCPVLEDLLIELKREYKTRVINVNIPSLQRLSLWLVGDVRYFSESYVVATPCLKYLKIVAEKESFISLTEPMVKLEEADIDVVEDVEKILQSVTSVRRLSLRALCNSPQEFVYPVGIVFNQLQHLKLCICRKDWSSLLILFLENSPKLQVLKLYVDTSMSNIRLLNYRFQRILKLQGLIPNRR
ncbi:unnamed protein product [Microthlaspi erraticum]|uniref:F-box/LRR-repeat protein 15/At3g58940/PEG3-like LRR domain-containing protein n=1 Tax=Microthlaspi erraticum TaxID=1685480 RepID=A0A6D2KID0_9BRAS|nr:unnamed protein product [Microthlaspi erraticum]